MARCPRRGSTSCWPARWVVPYIVVFLNKADKIDDKELLDLVELEGGAVGQVWLPGGQDADHPGQCVKSHRRRSGSLGVPSILKLLEAVDSYIPTPQRPILISRF